MFNENASVSNWVRFIGQWKNVETDYFYNYFRDYDPTLGRYLQSDPIGLNAGANTYTYVLNDPVNGVDPFGLYFEKGINTSNENYQKFNDIVEEIIKSETPVISDLLNELKTSNRKNVINSNNIGNLTGGGNKDIGNIDIDFNLLNEINKEFGDSKYGNSVILHELIHSYQRKYLHDTCEEQAVMYTDVYRKHVGIKLREIYNRKSPNYNGLNDGFYNKLKNIIINYKKSIQ